MGKINKLGKTTLKEKTIVIGRQTINYIDCGSGKPLLLVHGLNIGWYQWYPNIEHLAKYFRVYAIDLPGSGRSTDTILTNNFFEDNFTKIIQEFILLNDLKEVSFVGHSISCSAILKVIPRIDKRVKKVVLISPMGITNFMPTAHRIVSIYPLIKLLTSTVLKPTRKYVRDFLEDPMYRKIKINDGLIEYYYQSISKNRNRHPLLFMNSLCKMFRLKKEVIVNFDIASLKKSILIIFGQKDRNVEVQKIEDLYSKSKNVFITTLKDVGHVPSIEDATEVNKLIKNFLS